MRANDHNDGFWATFFEELETLRDVLRNGDFDAIFEAFIVTLVRSFEMLLGNETNWRQSTHLGWVEPFASSIAQSCWKLHL